jgi:hypothetical protein
MLSFCIETSLIVRHVGFVDRMMKRVADIDEKDRRFLVELYCCQRSVLWPGMEGCILEEILAVTFNF